MINVIDKLPICLGVELSIASQGAIEEMGEMCDLQIVKSRECAPGWSIDDLLDLACDLWKKCMDGMDEDSREKRLDDLERIGAEQNDYPFDAERRLPGSWVLPANWDNLDTLADYHIAQRGKEVDEELASNPLVYYASNLVFLVIGVLGLLFLIAGLVLGLLLAGGDEPKE
jgi:hypothetical protein